MKALLLVAIGGVAGSLLRWQLIEAMPSLSLGVFIVNQLGVLIAGIVAYRISATQSQKLFWITGFAGGFTTLSSLAFVLQGATLISGFGYAFASLLISLLILNLVRGKSRA
jgi:CrcB protein